MLAILAALIIAYLILNQLARAYLIREALKEQERMELSAIKRHMDAIHREQAAEAKRQSFYGYPKS